MVDRPRIPEFPRRRRHRAGGGRIRSDEMASSTRPQEAVGPAEPVPAQPEHPTRGVVRIADVSLKHCVAKSSGEREPMPRRPLAHLVVVLLASVVVTALAAVPLDAAWSAHPSASKEQCKHGGWRALTDAQG